MIDKINQIALNAGKAILEIYNSTDFGIETKADNSPLTLADKVSHDIIVKALAENFPVIPILSEEGKNIPYSERKQWDRFWLVDPLDGTKEFIKKNGEFTVNIAMIENGTPTLGVIYAPAYKSERVEEKSAYKIHNSEFIIPNSFSGTLYFGAQNMGAFKAYYPHSTNREIQDNSIFVTKISTDANTSEVIAVKSRSHSSEDEQNIVDDYGVTDSISVGSSLKFCMVAEGKAQIYYRHGPTNEWDVAAGHAIVNAAGGIVEGLSYNKENVLNSNFLVKNK